MKKIPFIKFIQNSNIDEKNIFYLKIFLLFLIFLSYIYDFYSKILQIKQILKMKNFIIQRYLDTI